MAEPVACTLQPRAFANRNQAWRKLLEGWLLDRQNVPDGVQLELQAAPGVAGAAKELTALEAACCPWMRIEVFEDADRVRLRVSSDQAAGRETIRSFVLGA